jgi:sarcosine oxidase subunit gamma
MAERPTRLSPVHDLVERLQPRWGVLDGMPVALTLGGRTVAEEQGLARTLALCDVSALPRLVIKGEAAASFLEARAVAPALPAEVLQVRLMMSGGLIARTGRAEFFLEDAPGAGVVARLTESLRSSPQAGVYPALRQDAAVLLAGDRVSTLLRQTCGYEFRQTDPGPDQAPALVMTRVAGVSTWVLHHTINKTRVFQLWADGTYGPYLWETLRKIVRELGGDAVGLSAFFPQV